MTRMRSIGLALGLGLAVLSCDNAAAPKPFAGEYILRRINTDTLPWVMYQDEFVVERVIEGYLEIDPAGAFTFVVISNAGPPAIDPTNFTPVMAALQGHWIRDGNTLEFHFVGVTDPISGSIANDVVTVHTNDLGVWEYRK
jgi:hypothetical protein